MSSLVSSLLDRLVCRQDNTSENSSHKTWMIDGSGLKDRSRNDSHFAQVFVNFSVIIIMHGLKNRHIWLTDICE